jgi:hypothetical protein
MIVEQWLRNFTVTAADVDDITNYLLEKETPMTTRELAVYVIDKRLKAEQAILEARYKNAKIYSPKNNYKVGERLMFSRLEFATAQVVDIRDGNNPAYGDFKVIKVKFDDAKYNKEDGINEFAMALTTSHLLSDSDNISPVSQASSLKAQDILESSAIEVMGRVLSALRANDDLKQVAGLWFPKDLVLEFDIGTLHLAEAVLDMMGGGPLTTEQIIEQIGGLGNAAMTLQVFSLNLAMSQDKRFDEVGPSGKILWFLKRMEPEVVQKVPDVLQYRPIDYDEELLTEDMVDLETELDDELTMIDFFGKITKATTTIIYPHRRAGALPLNAKTRQIFPTARTPRIAVTLIDEIDNERYSGWVVHEHKFVYGLFDYYTKYRLPVGAYVTVRKSDKEGEYFLAHASHKARTEYIPIFNPSAETIGFENRKRSIGADYDPLLILGVDDLAAIDQLAKSFTNKSLVTILRTLIHELSKLSPQNAVHFTTLYSAVNVIRRCPPGPIFAILQANIDFEDVGDYYWRITNQER